MQQIIMITTIRKDDVDEELVNYLHCVTYFITNVNISKSILKRGQGHISRYGFIGCIIR